MTDDDLRRRFEELRAAEMDAVPRFRVRERRHGRRTPQLAAAALLLLIVIVFYLRSRPVKFTPADRAAVHAVAAWHAPTDFLLQTPGREILATTPAIPDLKGASQ